MKKLCVILGLVALLVAVPASAAALTSQQISAIIGLLQAFGADQSVIANVQTALGGGNSNIGYVTPTNSQAPVITTFYGPTSLAVGQTGTWYVRAYSPTGNTLTLCPDWGDGRTPCQPLTSYSLISLTHSYGSFSGIYNLTMTVIDTDHGLSSKTTATVNVGNVSQPTITSISPAQGSSGTNITIYGGNLSGATSVGFYFPGQTEAIAAIAAANLTVTPNSITFTLPQSFDGMVSAGVYNVAVVTPNGTSNALSFTHIVPATQPSITVLSPNGGETWQIGSTYNIKYSANNIPAWDGINIYLQKGYGVGSTKPGVNSSLLIGQTSNTGNFSYPVPTGIASFPGLGSDYTILVCSNSTCLTSNPISDSSDNYFTIASGSQTQTPVLKTINVTPTSASLNVGGATQQLTATALDQNGNPINVALSWRSSNNAVATVSATGVVTPVAPGTATISASNSVAIIAGAIVSNSVTVTVTASNQPPPNQIPTNPTITVTAPTVGQTWTIGGTTPQTVSWSTANAPSGSTVNVYLVPAAVSLTSGSGYTIASNQTGTSFLWRVGSSNNGSVPAGDYSVKVCLLDSSGTALSCGQSPSFVTLVLPPALPPPPATTVSNTPVITVNIGTSAIAVGAAGTWSITAHNPVANDPGGLLLTVLWGDGSMAQYYTLTTDVAKSISHTFAKAGVFTVTFTVRNGLGFSARTTSTVNVGSVSVNSLLNQLNQAAAAGETSVVQSLVDQISALLK